MTDSQQTNTKTTDTDYSNQLTVTHKQENKEIPLHKIPINDDDKIFLKTLYDADEPLTTTQLKQQTGLSRRQISYRYDKFGREEYTEVLTVTEADPNNEYLPEQINNMNQAEMTDKGRKLINQGLIGDPNEKQQTPDNTNETLEEYQQQLDKLENKINALNETIDKQDQIINQLQTDLSETKNTINDYNQWKKRINIFVLATRKIFKDQNISLGKYIQQAKQETENNEN